MFSIPPLCKIVLLVYLDLLLIVLTVIKESDGLYLKTCSEDDMRKVNQQIKKEKKQINKKEKQEIKNQKERERRKQKQKISPTQEVIILMMCYISLYVHIQPTPIFCMRDSLLVTSRLHIYEQFSASR